MEVEVTERTAGIVTEAKEATYVEAARRGGGHRWWRYLLGLVVILVFWPGVGGIATRLVAFSLAGQEGLAALSRLDFAAFALFVPLALVLTAIQTTTEELFFRGYLVQGASVIWANRVFLALVSATIFTLPHLLNPEARSGGWLTVFIGYFVTGGLLWAIVSLVDGTTELAIGAHFAHNICSVLVVNHSGTVFTTPALIRVGEYDATFPESSLLVMIVLFLAIISVVSKREASQPVARSHWKGRRDPVGL